MAEFRLYALSDGSGKPRFYCYYLKMSEIERHINRLELILAAVLQTSIALISLGALFEGMWLVAVNLH